MQRRLRLRQSADFVRLRRRGHSLHHHWLILSWLPNDLAENRYGFVIGKQVGRAVERNRLRRQMREAVRLLHPQLASGFDVVIVARRDLLGQPFALIVGTLRELMIRAKLVRVESDSTA